MAYAEKRKLKRFFPQRGFVGLFKRPTKIDPTSHGFVPNHSSFSPISKTLGFSFVSEVIVSSVVSVLNSPKNPSNVFRLVISIVVNPIKGVFFGRSLTNIFIKIFKRLNPFITNLYTSFSIVFIMRVFGVVTSLFHRSPNIVLRRITKPMSRHKFSSNFSLFFTHSNILTQRLYGVQ